MTRRRLGLALVLGGAVLVVIGLGGLVFGRDSGETPLETIDTTSTSLPSTTFIPTTSTASSTATTTTTTTSTTTTTTMTSTTTTSTTTTTTIARSETVEEFVTLYRSAIDAGDLDFLLDRLHPSVVEGYGLEACRSWIDGAILDLEDYRLAGQVEGPRSLSFTTPAGTGVIEESYTARVGFTLEGQDFEIEAGFASLQGTMHWLGQCEATG